MDLIPVMASTDTTVYEYVFSNMYSTSDRKISELLSQRAKAKVARGPADINQFYEEDLPFKN